MQGRTDDDGRAASEIARRTLADQLRLVRRLLRRAAERANEDREHVHRLRVATRRAMETLRLYAPLLPEDETRRLAKQLRKIRRLTNAARDCDVMDEHLCVRGSRAAKTVRAIERRHRRRAQAPIETLAPRMRRRLERHARRLLVNIADAGELHADYAARVLAERIGAFREASVPDAHDVEALHRFRIEAKKLRYALELIRNGTAAIAVLKALQTHLGNVHDHAVAIERLQRWALAQRKSKRRAALVAEAAAERLALEQASNTFAAWWTRERRHDLLELIAAQEPVRGTQVAHP